VAGRKAEATRHSCAPLPTGLPRGSHECGGYGHSAGIRFDCFEAYMRSEVSEPTLAANFAIKVICYGYGLSRAFRDQSDRDPAGLIKRQQDGG
jgi:hypothetical protein